MFGQNNQQQEIGNMPQGQGMQQGGFQRPQHRIMQHNQAQDDSSSNGFGGSNWLEILGAIGSILTSFGNPNTPNIFSALSKLGNNQEDDSQQSMHHMGRGRGMRFGNGGQQQFQRPTFTAPATQQVQQPTQQQQA